MNLQIKLQDANTNALAGRKVLFTPMKSPEITASYMTVADSYQFTSSATGTISASVVASKYSVNIGSPTPATNFYLVATETGSYVYSGSAVMGSSQNVFFDLITLVKDPFSVKKVTLTPYLNYPVLFSSSITVLCSTSSITDSNGACTFDALVPGIYQVDAIGKVTTTFFVSVPPIPSTGVTAPAWNAKDLLVIKPSNGISVKLNNGDSSYVLTVSASDARYEFKGQGGSGVNAVSASWASSSLSASVVYSPNATIDAAGKANVSSLVISSSGAGGYPLEIYNARLGSVVSSLDYLGGVNATDVLANTAFIGNRVAINNDGIMIATDDYNYPIVIDKDGNLTGSLNGTADTAVELSNGNASIDSSGVIETVGRLTVGTINTTAIFTCDPMLGLFTTGGGNIDLGGYGNIVNTGTDSSITGSVFGTASYAQTASVCPNYLPKAGGLLTGKLELNTGASILLDNSCGGIQFAGGTSDDFTLSIFDNDVLQIAGRTGAVYFSASNVIGTASVSNVSMTASTIPQNCVSINSITCSNVTATGGTVNVLGNIQGKSSAANDVKILDGAGNSAFRSLRNTIGWSDQVSDCFFQTGLASDNQTFTALNGTMYNRVQFSAKAFQVNAGGYSSTPVPTDVFEVASSSVKVFGVSGTGQVSCNAITASTGVNNRGFTVPIIQAGSASTAPGGATSKIVAFNQAMPSNTYVVTLTPESNQTFNGYVSGKTANGFTASFSAYTGALDWMAIMATQ